MSDEELPPLDKVIAACKIGHNGLGPDAVHLVAAAWLERQQAEIERLRGREPVAWRWKYEDETSWTLAKNKPDYLFYYKDVICEPLYTGLMP